MKRTRHKIALEPKKDTQSSSSHHQAWCHRVSDYFQKRKNDAKWTFLIHKSSIYCGGSVVSLDSEECPLIQSSGAQGLYFEISVSATGIQADREVELIKDCPLADVSSVHYVRTCVLSPPSASLMAVTASRQMCFGKGASQSHLHHSHVVFGALIWRNLPHTQKQAA